MHIRQYAPREQWQRVQPEQLVSIELRTGARRARGGVEAYLVPAAREVGDERMLELLWLVESERAGIAYERAEFWTNASSCEEALDAWVAGAPEGVRQRSRS